MKSRLLVLLFSIVVLNVSAQSNRQANWQQEVNYTINVKLDDVNHILEGSEALEYTNNSPNSLDTIYFHIYPNAYRNNNTAFAKQQLGNGSTDFYYAPWEDRGHITELDFKIDGIPVKWEFDSENIDICYILPQKPIRPGATVLITTPFKVKIPHTFSRFGHIYNEYQITQWFPKPAVYDVNGWHPMPYLDLGEFYYEYGRFDVTITLPENYIVAATGELQNEYEKEWLNKLADQGPTSKTPSFTSSEKLKTLRYIQDSIHDFAWFASKRFVVTKGGTTLPSGKKVDSWVFAYAKSSDGIESINFALQNYSKYVGEYPYSHATVVVGPLEAGGGMEYPMITIVAFPGKQVIVHEVGHNWFQGILGSNERDYPWMDEGINNFYESLFSFDSTVLSSWNSLDKPKPINLFSNTYNQFKIGYDIAKWEATDQPSGIHSEDYTSLNYGLMVYGKNTLLFTYLRDYLGAEVFDNCMQTYFERWKFKHPLPGDIQAVFEEISGKDLEWFFVNLLTNDVDIDYKMVSADSTGSNWNVVVEQVGGAKVAVPIDCYKNGEVVKTVWLAPGETTATILDDEYSHFAISLKPYFLDINQQNNSIKTSGILKKTEKFSFNMGLNATVHNPKSTQLRANIIPAWNEHNHFMLGMTFYNSLVVGRKFEYRFTPLYSFSEGNVNGYAHFQFNDIKKKGAIAKIESGISAARFQYVAFNFVDSAYQGGDAQYTRISPFAVIHFRKSHPRSTVTNKVYEYFHYIQSKDNATEGVALAKPKFLDLTFEHRDDREINPWNYKIRLHENLDSASGKFRKLTGELNYTFNYHPRKQNRKVHIRLFGGTFLAALDSFNTTYAFRLGGNDGRMDYTFTDVLMDRSATSSTFSQQIIDREGNMRTLARNLYSFESIAAINIDWAFAGPLRLFMDAGYMTDYEDQLGINGESIQYVGGVSLVLGEDIFRINFPMVRTQTIEDNLMNNQLSSFGSRVTFSLNLKKLNPFTATQLFL